MAIVPKPLIKPDFFLRADRRPPLQVAFFNTPSKKEGFCVVLRIRRNRFWIERKGLPFNLVWGERPFCSK